MTDAAHARHSDPETSLEAALSWDAAKLNRMQVVVMRWVETRAERWRQAPERAKNLPHIVPWFSDEDLVDGLPSYGPSTLRTRRKELCDKGLLCWSRTWDRPEGEARRMRVWCRPAEAWAAYQAARPGCRDALAPAAPEPQGSLPL